LQRLVKKLAYWPISYINHFFLTIEGIADSVELVLDGT
jgi:hypothetical protein